MTRAYQPHQPAKRPGGKPDFQPNYRVLVHRQFQHKYLQLADRIGLQQAQEFWDHVAMTPGQLANTAKISILKGRAGRAADGWSRVFHFELTSMARANYRYHDAYQARPDGDVHKVVAILTLDYSSH